MILGGDPYDKVCWTRTYHNETFMVMKTYCHGDALNRYQIFLKKQFLWFRWWMFFTSTPCSKEADTLIDDVYKNGMFY